MPKEKTLRVYNLAELGVDVDTDNLHVEIGSFREAQNIHRNPTMSQADSIVTRKGLRNLNQLVLGDGPVLGGIALPAFVAGSGEGFLFLGFGD